MPKETKQAIVWALEQCEECEEFGEICVKGNGIINRQLLVDKVREYFNDNEIEYKTFNYRDLEPLLD